MAKHLEDDANHQKLVDTGKAVTSISIDGVKDVSSALEYITATIFSPLPDRAGMNSTRIAEVLNFQKNLPPVVTLAHVHALISASSKVEREVAALLATNQCRKLKIVGRGNDVSGISEVLLGTKHLEQRLRDSRISETTIQAFLGALENSPRTVSISSSSLGPDHVKELLHTGFLVSSSLSNSSRSNSNPTTTSSTLLSPPTISRAASGSISAVGGTAAFEQLGGVGTPSASTSNLANESRRPHSLPTTLFLSFPNLGTYLRLLNASRTHLLSLLSRSPHRETTLTLLRERWDGAVDTPGNRVSAAKRARGEFAAVLPAKTKKWRELKGVRFEWALEECVGAGLVELFDTGAVGLGVRCL